MKKKLLATAITASLLMGIVSPCVVSADSEASQNLSAAKQQIKELEAQKDALTGEEESLNAQLVKTTAGIESLDSQISDLEAEMEVTAADLAKAQESADTQYEAMKKRIQYLYEVGGDAGWLTVFLEKGNISDILTNEDYVQNMYKYDRDCLQEYADTVEQVETLQDQQNLQKADLEKNKTAQEEAKTKLEGLIAEAQAQSADVDAQLADVQAKANQYQSLVDQEQAAISKLQASQAAAIQEAVNKAAAQTGASAAEKQAAYNQIVQQVVSGNLSTGSSSGSSSGGSSSSGISGSDILAYAQQFLGNKYVYGGNSLTNGVDCSGFVQQVYSHFGIQTSRTSWDIENNGVEVSYDDIQVGDVLCYDGHVGIYAGNGQMINAANEKYGITYTPTNYRDITTIRRLV